MNFNLFGKKKKGTIVSVTYPRCGSLPNGRSKLTGANAYKGDRNRGDPTHFVKIEFVIQEKDGATPQRTKIEIYGASEDGKELRGPLTTMTGKGFTNETKAKHALNAKFPGGQRYSKAETVSNAIVA